MHTLISSKILVLAQIAGLSAFLGYIIISLLLKLISRRSGDLNYLNYVTRFITKTDKTYYGISSMLLVISSLFLNPDYLQVGYKLTSLILISLTGIIWIAILVPIQNKQTKVIVNHDGQSGIPLKFIQLDKIWFTAGAIALLLTLISIFLMIN